MPKATRRRGYANVDGQRINIANDKEAVARIVDAVRRRMGFTFFTLNLDHLVKRRRDPQFRAAYARADFVSADGAPVAALARREAPQLKRATGADLLPLVAQAAARHDIPVAIFGTSAASISAASERLTARFEALRIVFSEAPPSAFDPASAEARAAGQRIAASGARLCFVALGAPKQEVFADLMRQIAPHVGFICVGAAVDFQAGLRVRAPWPIRAIGGEWLWRLSLEPRRLGLRYWLCGRLLVDLVLAPPPSRVRAPQGVVRPAE